MHAKDAPAESAGGMARQTYIGRGARLAHRPAVWKQWGLYSGEIGDVGTSFIGQAAARRGLYRHASLLRYLSTLGQYPTPDLPKIAPVAPIESIPDCRRCYSRATGPLFPRGALLSTESKGRHAAPGATQGAWSSAQRRHPPKSRTPAAYTPPCPGISRPAAGPRCLWRAWAISFFALTPGSLQPRARPPSRRDNATTAGRDRAARRVGGYPPRQKDVTPT